MPAEKPTTVDEYIARASDRAQPHLRAIRAILRSVAPGATEAIKWGYPVLEEKRILFSFSAHASHLTFMPTGPAMAPFAEALAPYETGKDTIKFRYDRPLPEDLIREIAAFRAKDVRENDARWMY